MATSEYPNAIILRPDNAIVPLSDNPGIVCDPLSLLLEANYTGVKLPSGEISNHLYWRPQGDDKDPSSDPFGVPTESSPTSPQSQEASTAKSEAVTRLKNLGLHTEINSYLQFLQILAKKEPHVHKNVIQAFQTLLNSSIGRSAEVDNDQTFSLEVRTNLAKLINDITNQIFEDALSETQISREDLLTNLPHTIRQLQTRYTDAIIDKDVSKAQLCLDKLIAAATALREMQHITKDYEAAIRQFGHARTQRAIPNQRMQQEGVKVRILKKTAEELKQKLIWSSKSGIEIAVPISIGIDGNLISILSAQMNDLQTGESDNVSDNGQTLGPGQITLHSHPEHLSVEYHYAISYGDVLAALDGPLFVDPDTEIESPFLRLFAVATIAKRRFSQQRRVTIDLYKIDLQYIQTLHKENTLGRNLGVKHLCSLEL